MVHQLALTRGDRDLHGHHTESCRLACAVGTKQAIHFTLLAAECIPAYCHSLGLRVGLAKIDCTDLEVFWVGGREVCRAPHLLLMILHVLSNFQVWRQFTIHTTSLLVAIANAHVNQHDQGEDDEDLVGEYAKGELQVGHVASRDFERLVLQVRRATIADILSDQPEGAQWRKEKPEGEAILEGLLFADDACDHRGDNQRNDQESKRVDE